MSNRNNKEYNNGSSGVSGGVSSGGVWRSTLVLCVVVAYLTLSGATVGLAGKASSGQLLFYPCTSCHPTGKTAQQLHPNAFKKHEIKLIGHDKLGGGKGGLGVDACLVCHDLPTKDPGMLKTIDGTLTSVNGAVARVCYRCHSDKYKEWQAGMHGRMPLELGTVYGENTKDGVLEGANDGSGERPGCTVKGCHDPHTPGWIGVAPLLPFQGTTIEVKLVPEREPFTALPKPPSAPAVDSPGWLKVLALLGFLMAGGAIGTPFLLERLKR